MTIPNLDIEQEPSNISLMPKTQKRGDSTQKLWFFHGVFVSFRPSTNLHGMEPSNPT